jgi:hypothetical protein
VRYRQVPLFFSPILSCLPFVSKCSIASSVSYLFLQVQHYCPGVCSIMLRPPSSHCISFHAFEE